MSAGKDRKENKDPLREHELAKKLAKKGQPGNSIRVMGYIGQSDLQDTVRLYLNLEFDEYLTIKKENILNAEEVSEDDLEYGGTCLWVDKNAEISHTKVESTKEEARFLGGLISAAQIKAGAGTGGTGGGCGGASICANDTICVGGTVCANSLCARNATYCAYSLCAGGTLCLQSICVQTLCVHSICGRGTICQKSICAGHSVCAGGTICVHSICGGGTIIDTPGCPIEGDFTVELRTEVNKLKARLKALEENLGEK